MILDAEGATAIDEGLFEDEDLDELEDDLQNLEVWFILRSNEMKRNKSLYKQFYLSFRFY